MWLYKIIHDISELKKGILFPFSPYVYFLTSFSILIIFLLYRWCTSITSLFKRDVTHRKFEESYFFFSFLFLIVKSLRTKTTKISRNCTIFPLFSDLWNHCQMCVGVENSFAKLLFALQLQRSEFSWVMRRNLLRI